MKKQIWKLKFRLRQLKAFFKWKEYQWRIERGRTNDDTFYYVMQRDLMKDLALADPEQEYLEEHGLLPDEPEPEPEPEPMPEPEVGLIREFGFMEIRPVHMPHTETSYFACQVKEYEDRTLLRLQIVGGEDSQVREEELTVPHVPGGRWDSFELDGENWRWDRADCALRYMPGVDEFPEEAAQAPAVRTLQGLALRVEKNLAEQRLSPQCLSYAYRQGDVGYDWCIPDYSCYTVFHELEMSQDTMTGYELRQNLAMYCRSYYEHNLTQRT